MASEGKELSEALHEAFEKHPELTVKAFDQVIGESAAVNTALRRDLAAANATIEALQADLAGTAELLLREQALAESRSLALATMREALEGAKIPHLEVDGDPWFSCCLSRADRDYCLRHDDRKKPCPGYCTCGAADHNARIDAILAQPADAAAALAAAVLAAADAMYERAHQEWGVDHTEFCECDRSRIEADTCECPESQALVAYRRARAALRGDGAAT